MQTQCIRIPLRPEHAETFIAFARSLAEDPRTLAEVLFEEDMHTELVFIDRTPDELAVVLFTRAPDLAAAHAVLERSEHPVQIRMRALSAQAFDLSDARVLDVVIDYDRLRDGPPR
tara:strand:+ start:322 stop:669 length:348 start_codon:yes stop_codon:yes gene_type:complete